MQLPGLRLIALNEKGLSSDDLDEAMTAELARSTERLKLNKYEAPYFVSYQVRDVTKNELEGRYGALFEDASRRDRNLYVDVRVGSYDLDSSGPDDPMIVLDGGDGPTWFAPKDAPLDGVEQAGLMASGSSHLGDALTHGSGTQDSDGKRDGHALLLCFSRAGARAVRAVS